MFDIYSSVNFATKVTESEKFLFVNHSKPEIWAGKVKLE